jgi:hypothetical protein
MLMNNEKVPIYVQLLMDATDSHYYGDCRVAVTEAESAFEVFVQEFVATSTVIKEWTTQEHLSSFISFSSCSMKRSNP